MKKFVMTTALAFAFLLSGTGVSAQQSDTQSQIEELLAQLAALQGGTTVSGECAANFTYSGVLRQGSNGQAVMDLQTDLNTFNNAGLVVDGAFGPGTRAAVVNFQASQGLVADGIVGLQTSNALGVVAQAACENMMDDDDMDDMDDEDMDEDEDEGADDDDFPFDRDGDEASLEDFELEDEEDDAQEGDWTHVATAEFDVEDADVRIERMEITFDPGSSNQEDEPWDTFETIMLMIDGEEVAEEDVTDEDDWLEDDEPYEYRLDLDYIADEDEKVEIEIWVEVQNGVDGVEDDTEDWTIYVQDEGIRALDTAGVDQYIGDDNDEVEFTLEEEGDDEELDVSESNSNPDATTLEVDEDDDSEWYEILVADFDSEEGELEFDSVEATVFIYGSGITITTDGGASDTSVDEEFETVIADLELRADGEEIDDFDVVRNTTLDTEAESDGQTPVRAYVVTFDVDNDIMIDEGETEFSIWAEFNAIGDAGSEDYNEGTEVSAAFLSDNVENFDVEGADDLDTDQLEGSARGELMTLRSEGLEVDATNANESSSAMVVNEDGDDNDYAEFELELEIMAFEEDAFIDEDTATSFTFEIVDSNSGDVVYDSDGAVNDQEGTATVALDSSADLDGDYYRVDESSTEDFTLSVTFDPYTTPGTGIPADAGSYRLRLNTIEYNDTATGPDSTFSATPASDYRTRSAQIVN